MSSHGTVPHTLLFSGPDGIGKKTIAKAFAKDLGCKPADTHEFFPQGKSHQHTIDSMGEVIRLANEFPFESPKKCILIYEAERMLPSSSNALLKTLEEPLESTVIILITSHEEHILETIRSRSISVRFRRLSEEEIVQILTSKGIENPQALAKLSPGSVPHEGYGHELRQSVAQAIRFALSGDLTSAFESLTFSDEVDPKAMLQHIIVWVRDAHLAQLEGAEEFLYWKEDREVYREYTSLPTLASVHKMVAEAEVALAHNIKAQTVLERVLSLLFIGEADDSLVAR